MKVSIERYPAGLVILSCHSSENCGGLIELLGYGLLPPRLTLAGSSAVRTSKMSS
ncbi:MAG: hypothetical protein AAGF98_16505 [Cyanobacteria bacterium P01_H01_bin.153]